MTSCSKCKKLTIWVERNKGTYMMFDFVEQGGKKVATFAHNERCPARLQAEAEKVCPFCWINKGMNPKDAIRLAFRPCRLHTENDFIVFDGVQHSCTQLTIITLVAYVKRREKSMQVAQGNGTLFGG